MNRKPLFDCLTFINIQMRFHMDFEPTVPSVHVTLRPNDILKASQKPKIWGYIVKCTHSDWNVTYPPIRSTILKTTIF
jgi:hypothetical protein